MGREPPPASIVAAAQHEHRLILNELAALIEKARDLTADKHTEAEAVTELWMTLLCNDPRMVAIIAASAIMQLATAGSPNPGSPHQ